MLNGHKPHPAVFPCHMGLKKQRRPVLPNLHGKISKNDVYRLRPEKFDEKVMGNRLGNTWKSGMNSFFPGIIGQEKQKYTIPLHHGNNSMLNSC